MITRLRNRRTWVKWVIAILGLLFLVPCLGYVCLFVRMTPPLSIQVVDAITGKPLRDMDVCMQAVDDGFGSEQALRSELLSTDGNGKVFFWPSVNDVPLLGQWDGYSIQVSDPNSNFNISCGPHVGFALEHFRDELADSRTDGTQYFPVQFGRRAVYPRQRFGPWTNRRGGGNPPIVHLIPILPNVRACDQIHDSRSREECKQLNTETEAFFPHPSGK